MNSRLSKRENVYLNRMLTRSEDSGKQVIPVVIPVFRAIGPAPSLPFLGNGSN